MQLKIQFLTKSKLWAQFRLKLTKENTHTNLCTFGVFKRKSLKGCSNSESASVYG